MSKHRTPIKMIRHGVPLPKSDFKFDSVIEILPVPETVYLKIPSSRDLKYEVLVKKGDQVTAGQPLVTAGNDHGITLHATVNGEVKEIVTSIDPYSNQVGRTIVISTGEDKGQGEYQDNQAAASASVAETLERIRAAGIVSTGNEPKDIYDELQQLTKQKIDTVILNGCMTDLHVTANPVLIMNYCDEVLSGLDIITNILAPGTILVVIESYCEEIIKKLENKLAEKNSSYTIVPVKPKYPIFDNTVMIKTLLNRDIPVDGNPADVHVAVFDTATAKAIHDAVVLGKPQIERIVSIVGAVKNPKNLMVRIGTPISQCLDFCGGSNAKEIQAVSDGTIKGTVLFSLESPVNKNTDCVLVKESKQQKMMDCINCGRCLDACPVFLMPSMLTKFARKGQYSECLEYHIHHCVECFACAYVCPSNIPIVEFIRIAKREINGKHENKEG